MPTQLKFATSWKIDSDDSGTELEGRHDFGHCDVVKELIVLE